MNIEEKINQLSNKVEKLEDENESLKRENKQIKSKIGDGGSTGCGNDQNRKLSRRGFIKKLGIGAAGLGALSLSPAAALNIRSDDLDFYGADNTPEFSINDNGPVEVNNANLNLNNNNILSVSSFNGADIENASSGQVPTSQGDGTLAMEGKGGVPSGCILLWSGAVSDIPSGWTLCDGNNGAPDLQDRFVVGAGNSYSVGETGGFDSVSLSVSQLPSHDHGDGSLDVDSHDHGSGSLSTSTDGSHSHSYENFIGGNYNEYNSIQYDGGNANNTPQNSTTGSAGSHNHSISGSTGNTSPGVHGSTGATGSGNSHENRPPYYALAFIMKL